MWSSGTRSPFPSALMFVLLGTVGPYANAQETSPPQLTILDEVQCSGCDLSLRPVQELGTRQGSELLAFSHKGRIARDGEGSLWVRNAQIPGTIQIFDAEGRLTMFSHPGQGPGEFQAVIDVGCLQGDILFTAANRRFHVVRVGSREISASPPTLYGAYSKSLLALSDTVAWVSAPPADPTYLGYPIVSFNVRTGRVLGAWGRTVRHYDNMVRLHALRTLERFPGGRVLAGHNAEYVLDVYAPNGELLRQIVRDAPWFRPQLTPFMDQTLAVALPIDERHVLTSVLVRPPAYEPRRTEGPVDPEITKRYDSIIEVLDIVEGRVLVRQRLDDPVIASVCPTGEVAAAGLTGDLGLEKLTVYKIRFTSEES